MSRVEWTRLEGNDVEAVVAMFVNREHVDSTRISPSRGDGGVDILDRGAAVDGGDVVRQVKSYCGPLSSKQKEEVENSLRTLISDPRWSRLRVTTWYLVTPWDPTPEADAWLQGLGKAHGLASAIQAVTNNHLDHAVELRERDDDVRFGPHLSGVNTGGASASGSGRS